MMMYDLIKFKIYNFMIPLIKRSDAIQFPLTHTITVLCFLIESSIEITV